MITENSFSAPSARGLNFVRSIPRGQTSTFFGSAPSSMSRLAMCGAQACRRSADLMATPAKYLFGMLRGG